MLPNGAQYLVGHCLGGVVRAQEPVKPPLSEHLLLGAAKHVCRPRAPIAHHAALVDDRDGVGHVREDGDLPFDALAGAHGLGDVSYHGETERLPGDLDWRGGYVDPEPRAVLPAVVVQGRAYRPGLLHVPAQQFPELFAFVLRDQDGDILLQ